MKLSGLSRLLASITLLLGLVLGSSPTLAQEPGDEAAGELKAHTCLGCHGVQHYVNVYPTYHVPYIAGQHSQYLVAALQAYRSGERPHTTMRANANLLTDEDIADISAWLSRSTKSHEIGLVGDEEPKAKACIACHGETGISASMQWPNLAGQYKSYIKQALEAYRSGARPNAIMRGIAAGLTDEDIDDLAEYFSRQDGPLRTAPTNN